MLSNQEVRVKHEVDETDVHLKLEVEETKLRIKQEIEEMDNLLKLKSSEFLESRKAKQVLIEAFMGRRELSYPDNWSISYPKWTYRPLHHGLYAYQRAPTTEKPILVVIQKKVDIIFLSELISHSIKLLGVYKDVPNIVVMCLEGIDDEVRILFDQVNDGAYVASNSFWENDLYVVTPELTPHRKSTLENLMAQQFDKFKQSYN